MPAHRNEIIDMLIRRLEKERERKREHDHKGSSKIVNITFPHPSTSLEKKSRNLRILHEDTNLVFLGTPLHPHTTNF
jgi:metal-responsive CopG/Arc/MetJ family transcriptional regulator